MKLQDTLGGEVRVSVNDLIVKVRASTPPLEEIT
jgi:hypothetical protein